eukprot:m.103839 g.103839  ORF g.103839 m.103839 type:complete len:93 (-) comp12594_c0_seq1:3033-3311(-)
MHGYVNSALVLWLVGAVSMADAATLRQSDPSDLTRSSAPRWSNETQTAFYMRKAIEQAKDAVRNGGGPFGALVGILLNTNRSWLKPRKCLDF